MQKYILWVCAVILMTYSIIGPHAYAQTKPAIAVFDIKNRHVQLAGNTEEILNEYLSTKLVAAAIFEVVPGEKVKKELTKKKFESFETRFSQGSQIEIGKELAAQYTLSTQIMKVGGAQCMVSSTLYDLKKSTAQKAAIAQGACNQEGLMKAIDELVGKLGATDVFGNQVVGIDGKKTGPSANNNQEKLQVSIWTDRGSGETGGTYTKGDLLYVFVKVNKDCYLRLHYESADGTNVQIFPNAHYIGDSKLRAGNVYVIPGVNDSFEFEVTEPFGRETIIALASTQPFEGKPQGQVTESGLTLLKEPLRDTVGRTRGIMVKNRKAEFAEGTLNLTTQPTTGP